MRKRARQRAARLRSGAPGAILGVWRSPSDQPAWARPALIALAAVSGLAYAWGIDGAALETFYGAAARSMSTSWHDFFFGAFDPAGTVSIDKLPGSLWPQALLLRLVGFHVWALVAPQAIEGVAAVLVLYRAVRRLTGPLAGIAAAAVLTSSPVTVALNRGNVADSLLILLLVLAADATTSALLSGRLRTLLLAAVWVGLAFQAKMLVAWLVLPALAGAYLLAAPAHVRVRVAHLALAAVVTVAVSLSWMTVVSLVPAHSRPYVDGTQNDSIFSQTFQYNGFARLERRNVFAGSGPPPAFLVRLSEAGVSPAHQVKPSWHRLLDGLFGRDDGWLLPAALIAAACVLISRRQAGRRDPLRASVVLWGLWLLVFAAFFSAGGYPNSYYVAALAPATGALCGAGAELARRASNRTAATSGLAVALLSSVGYGIYLLRGGTGVPGWLIPLAAVVGVVGAATLLTARRVGILRSPTSAIVLALTCALLLPAVASVLMVVRGLGPFAAPYERASATVSRASARQALLAASQAIQELSSTYGTPTVLVTDSSILAAPFILATGEEILPIGGYEGDVPAPSLADLRRSIAAGELRAFLVPVLSNDPRIAWIHAHCQRQGAQEEHTASASTELYACGAS
jgi:4-amino-4-deoxy-L-arabinose transferase-like glycosyltransferase